MKNVTRPHPKKTCLTRHSDCTNYLSCIKYNMSFGLNLSSGTHNTLTQHYNNIIVSSRRRRVVVVGRVSVWVFRRWLEKVCLYNMYDNNMMYSIQYVCNMLFILHISYRFPKTGTGGVVRIPRVRIYIIYLIIYATINYYYAEHNIREPSYDTDI